MSRYSTHLFRRPRELFSLGSRARPLKVFTRTPITQLKENDRHLVIEVLGANKLAIEQHQREGLIIDHFEHEFRDKHQQFSFLSDAQKAADFRKERLNGLLKANIFHEIFIDTSLSVSGGAEHGYFRLLLKQHKIFSRETKEAMCTDWNRHVSPLMEGGCFITTFLGQVPTTTFYKADPFTVPILLVSKQHNHQLPSEQEIKKTLPGVLICEDLNQLTDTYFKAYQLAHQKIINREPILESLRSHSFKS